MGWLKSIFSSDKKPTRKLEHPKALVIGDVIGFSDSFGLPELLRKQNFKVDKVATYAYNHQNITELTLFGNTETPLFLAVEENDTEWLNLSIKLTPAQVDQLFSLDQFSQIFDSGHQHNTLKPIKEVAEFDRWVSDLYEQITAELPAYYIKGDYRGKTVPNSAYDEGEELRYYALEGMDGKGSVEIEVYDGGDTEVSLTIRRPITDINELFMGEG